MQNLAEKKEEGRVCVCVWGGGGGGNNILSFLGVDLREMSTEEVFTYTDTTAGRVG